MVKSRKIEVKKHRFQIKLRTKMLMVCLLGIAFIVGSVWRIDLAYAMERDAQIQESAKCLAEEILQDTSNPTVSLALECDDGDGATTESFSILVLSQPDIESVAKQIYTEWQQHAQETGRHLNCYRGGKLI